MPLYGQLMDLFHYIHASYDLSECSKSLSIWIAFATKIEFRLIIDANKK